MDIQTAAVYARHGYKIFRRAWRETNFVNVVSRSIYIVKEQDGSLSFVNNDSSYTILSPEECLANDWELILTE